MSPELRYSETFATGEEGQEEEAVVSQFEELHSPKILDKQKNDLPVAELLPTDK